MTHNGIGVGIAAASVLAFGISAAAIATANDADVIQRGSSGASDWKLKASPEDGRIEVEGEVDSNVNDQQWNWRIRHNGDVAARGSAFTTGPSGSFKVRRLVGDAADTDRIGWRARNPNSGEVCRGGLSF